MPATVDRRSVFLWGLERLDCWLAAHCVVGGGGMGLMVESEEEKEGIQAFRLQKGEENCVSSQSKTYSKVGIRPVWSPSVVHREVEVAVL